MKTQTSQAKNPERCIPNTFATAATIKESYGRMAPSSQNPAKGRADLAWRKRSSCNLVKQRLEEVIVPAVHQRYVDQIRFKVLRRTKAAEPAAYNYNSPWTAHCFLNSSYAFNPQTMIKSLLTSLLLDTIARVIALYEDHHFDDNSRTGYPFGTSARWRRW
jgi:hypothetical protein